MRPRPRDESNSPVAVAVWSPLVEQGLARLADLERAMDSIEYLIECLDV